MCDEVVHPPGAEPGVAVDSVIRPPEQALTPQFDFGKSEMRPESLSDTREENAARNAVGSW